MKNNLLLSRKDHEVYFFSRDIPDKRIKPDQYINDKLHELHPAYSSLSVFDSKRITIRRKTWLMVTVMSRELLAEYRLEHPASGFFTRTSLLLYMPDITEHPEYIFPDEIIGYSKETDEPLSIPSPGRNSPWPEHEKLINALLLHAPARHRLFRKKPSPLVILLPFVIGIIAVIAIVTMQYTARKAPEAAREPHEVINEPDGEITSMPSPFAMLADIADILVTAGGTMLQWHYYENADPAFIIPVSGADTARLYTQINLRDYVRVQGISEIRYENSVPLYTLNLSCDPAAYPIPGHIPFTGPEQELAFLAVLRSALSAYPVQIISEIVPSAAQGNGDITIAFTCDSRYFVNALEQVEDLFSREGMRILFMTIAFDRPKNTFTCTFSFTPIPEGVPVSRVLGENKASILPAFGYTEPEAKPPPVTRTVAAQAETEIDVSGYTKIGVIRDEEDKKIVYYRNSEGKIVTREEAD
ncbi:hypothetical protein FACS189483_01400 [Spirochaetia bacterium]|nr:hypothetical protein FACS189483_01400 [Spirochaetia bacterium]